MFTNYTNMNMLNMNGMFGMNNCGTNFFAGGCNNMLGSIFGFGNNAFYNPCDGTYDYDAMAGWGVASTLANIGLGILDQHMASKQAKKAQPSLSEQISDIDGQIQEQADKIGIKAEEVATHKIEQEYLDAESTANKNLEAAKTKSQNLAGEIVGLASEIETLKAQRQTVPADATEEQKTQIETANKNIDDQIAAKEAEKAKKTKEQEQLDKDIEGKLQTAVDTAMANKENRVNLIKEVQADVAELQKEKTALIAQKDAQDFANAAKKADGNIFTRDHNFDIDKFDENNTKIGQPQLKALILGFTKKDATEAEKKKYADALKSLDNAEFYALKPDKNQEMIWKAAKEYQTK